MQTSIVKWGNSQGIRLPKALLERANISCNDRVEINAEGDKLVIQKATPSNRHKTIQERFAAFDGEHKPHEMDWGEPVGNEIW